MAFTVEGFVDQLAKRDPRYVKWIVRLVGTQDGQEIETVLPHHDCTDEDFKDFNPVSSRSEFEFERMRNSPERGFICIDWTDDLLIYGEENRSKKYQRLEFNFVPCNYIHQHLGYTEDRVAEECIADLEKQKEYLGPLDFVIYFNYGEFNQQKFGDESIVQEARLKNV